MLKRCQESASPPNDSRFYQNYIRDYHGHILELDGISYVQEKSLLYHQKQYEMRQKLVGDHVKIRYKHIKTLINHGNKVLDDQYFKEKMNSYKDFVSNYKRKARGLAQDMEDEVKTTKIDTMKLAEIKESTKKEFDPWVEQYLTKVGPLKKKPKARLSHWYGQFMIEY